ncbi:hypothetical protein Pmani_017633 [Petrolisthes manimaculis]|uniref:Uncharacterized protein n=1 Tax=Petrolisthes manimaculis TaxID=1843537 RepID=A0AAE1U5L4_9EUCA|nr:hypothetical protein Pmani_017633 [Petrolisthes manimaculis]
MTLTTGTNKPESSMGTDTGSMKGEILMQQHTSTDYHKGSTILNGLSLVSRLTTDCLRKVRPGRRQEDLLLPCLLSLPSILPTYPTLPLSPPTPPCHSPLLSYLPNPAPLSSSPPTPPCHSPLLSYLPNPAPLLSYTQSLCPVPPLSSPIQPNPSAMPHPAPSQTDPLSLPHPPTPPNESCR